MAAKAVKRPTGRTIEVERVVSVGRDRELEGGAAPRGAPGGRGQGAERLLFFPRQTRGGLPTGNG